MKVLVRITIVFAALAAGGVARADHHGMMMEHADGDASSYTASVSLLAATFSPSLAENMFYGGSYQGVIAGGGWAMGPYAAGASWAYYRIIRNGIEYYGIGDFIVHGQVAWITRPDMQAGVALAASVPTGDDTFGFGMGHSMVMPAGYAAWHVRRLVLAASFGYSRALASVAHVHDKVLVEPMNMQELTWSASGDIAVGAGMRAGVRASGGVPIASPDGSDRVIGAARVAWGSGRVDTAAELQAGLAGDPFNIRGVVSTALRF